jgi:hypothetical protein
MGSLPLTSYNYRRINYPNVAYTVHLVHMILHKNQARGGVVSDLSFVQP